MRRRGPRRPPPALDRAQAGQDLALRWQDAAARFLVAVESSVLAGEAKLPPGLYRNLHVLLRGDPT